MNNTKIETHATCFHCGAETRNALVHDEKDFCCNGCLTVYSILEKNNLCQYYDFNEAPGNTVETKNINHRFAFLEDEQVLNKLILFKQDNQIHISYYLPQVHCSSCLYLLENLFKIHTGVLSSKLNFSQKELTVIFDNNQTSAFKIAKALTQLGYEPYFSLSDVGEALPKSKSSKTRLYRLGVAGFAFGNIMLLSFPEYFAYGTDLDGLKPYFQWIILSLIVPVITYSASEFYSLAWGGIKERYLNIDLPIVLAMLITFFRSIYEVFTHTGPGYFDSLSGIVFFMLLGRLLQDRTYKSITFDRDFTSYFPISTTIFKQGKETSKQLNEIQINDELIIHDREIIPVDGLLVGGRAVIDYSFVTGESKLVELDAGGWVYAGGRQMGTSIRIMAQKTVSQSYLVSLWNKQDKKTTTKSQPESKYVQKASMYFTLVLFSIAISAGIYWSIVDPSKLWNSVTAVLIVACPCALLLSVTFTHGHFLSLFAKNGLYLKGSKSMERFNQIKRIVFDKTGTLTQTNEPIITYNGAELSEFELDAVGTIARESIHPNARNLSRFLNRVPLNIEHVENHLSRGISAKVLGIDILMGSSEFVGNTTEIEKIEGSGLWIKINGKVKGVFLFKSAIRQNLGPAIAELSGKYKLSMLSGDNDTDKQIIHTIFPQKTDLLFGQKPHDKKVYVETLERSGYPVMMVGDGLNDAGALMGATVGLAVTEDVSYFTPGSDAIILGSALNKLLAFLVLARKMRNIIWISFAISILYNIVGLSFAVQGQLNPIIAAILMPASSISIVLVSWIGSLISAKILGLKI